MNILQIGALVVENYLRCEIVEAGLSGAELEADDPKALSRDHSCWWEAAERLGWVLQHLVENRGVRSVHYLHRLIR